jgi:hypothetical protein
MTGDGQEIRDGAGSIGRQPGEGLFRGGGSDAEQGEKFGADWPGSRDGRR